MTEWYQREVPSEWLETAQQEIIEEIIFRSIQGAFRSISAPAARSGRFVVRWTGRLIPGVGATLLVSDVSNLLTYLEKEYAAFTRPSPPARTPTEGTLPYITLGGGLIV